MTRPYGRRRALRHFWVQVHLWLGLVLGGLFAILGLTGSVLCFYPEIDLGLNPAHKVVSGGRPVSLQKVLDALRDDRPGYTGAWRLEMPLAAGWPITARYYRPPETAHRAFKPYLATIDPHSLHIGSRRYWGDYAMTWVYDLHYTLLLEKPGRITVGALGLGALASLLSGLYLWWPSRGRWRAALRPEIRRGRIRATYDWHVRGGVYGLLVLLVVCFSGLLLAWPEYLNPLIERVAPLTRQTAPQSVAMPSAPMIGVDAAVVSALARLPGGTVRWIETPADATGTYRINLWLPSDPGRRFPRSNVWVDAYSGTVLAVRDWRQGSAGDGFLAWMHPLHNGEAFGLPGRILACLAGLLPALLWVTGVMRWRQKSGARNKLQAGG